MLAFQQVNTKQFEINPFEIRKTVDIKRLKNLLWEELEPALEDGTKLQMSTLMDNLYYSLHKCDDKDVSVQSAFISMLHLANEKNLSFKAIDEGEADFRITKIE